MVLAFLCFAVKVLLGLFNGSSGKLDLVALGLAFWVLALLTG